MNIRRASLIDGARQARGIAVIIDVFRAFTCEPFMYHFGAEAVYLESDIEKCKRLRGNSLLVGEKDELPIESFDLTNSPSLIIGHGRIMFGGRTVIHRTTAGVAGALAAIDAADEVLLASFVNAGATAAYIREKNPGTVSIVGMGIRTLAPAPEDEACGDYIEHLLSGRAYDHAAVLGSVLAGETAQKFLRGDKSYLPREDPAICLQRDLFPFALKAARDGELVRAECVHPGA